MGWFRQIFPQADQDADPSLRAVQAKFRHFLALLDQNNLALKTMSDMEEKAQGEYLFDLNYIRASLAQVRAGVGEIIEHMIGLGGDRYGVLRERLAAIDAEVNQILPGNRPIAKDEFTIPFDRIGRERAFSVGSKNAQLGEMKSALKLPVPEGFAVSAWAYKYFVDANDLQGRISRLLESLHLKSYDDLRRVSEQIQEMVCQSPVPEDLVAALRRSLAWLQARAPSGRIALRSSAIGEDSQFSFAGQYASFLNVRGDELVDRYRQVLAGKFTPKAIYYFLSHALTESELAMSVVGMAMVDAAVSGVIYTRDPVRPDDDCLLVSSIYGLGKYLVDGTITPDVFRLGRGDRAVREVQVARKPVRLVLREQGGTLEEAVPAAEQEAPSLQPEQLATLAGFALQVEAHYGCAQDIEWAIDLAGRPFLLQTRPLRLLKAPAPVPDVSRLPALLRGGTTVCPGAGAGRVFQAASPQDLPWVPEAAVVVAPHPFPGLITVMGRVRALVTGVGGVASHLATLAREYRIPTLAGLPAALELAPGLPVTVDAANAVIYAGIHPDLAAARRPDSGLFEDTAIIALLQALLAKISPLHLLHPADPEFVPENCRTWHDLTRFAHQKAMEEMFAGARKLEQGRIGLRLRSEIPLQVNLVDLDQGLQNSQRRGWITEEELASEPMRAFWNGLKFEGWPQRPPAPDFKGLISIMGKADQVEFSENNFAMLSKEYMILSLGMGYHVTSVEAMATAEPSKNYIRMQFKAGGASLDRRLRRIKLITDLLARMGFENLSRGDFLDTMLSYQDRQGILEQLFRLGRLTMMTKQLDMALSNDALAQWYTEDFLKRLGLTPREAGPPNGGAATTPEEFLTADERGSMQMKRMKKF